MRESFKLKKRPTVGSLWVCSLGSLSFSLIIRAGFLQPADCIVFQLKQSICTVETGEESKVESLLYFNGFSFWQYQRLKIFLNLS